MFKTKTKHTCFLFFSQSLWGNRHFLHAVQQPCSNRHRRRLNQNRFNVMEANLRRGGRRLRRGPAFDGDVFSRWWLSTTCINMCLHSQAEASWSATVLSWNMNGLSDRQLKRWEVFGLLHLFLLSSPHGHLSTPVIPSISFPTLLSPSTALMYCPAPRETVTVRPQPISTT